MCGRYILVQKLEQIAQRFEIDISDIPEYASSYNICPGQQSLVIANRGEPKMEMMRFGLTPFWSKKSMMLINSRSEGDRNKENDPKYRGAKNIITKPSFRKPIRSQRCLVIADAFIEGTTKEGLNKPYLVFLKNKQRPFAFAGIWDEWVDPKTGNVITGFSIITTTPNELMQKLPHHRSPVILRPYQEKAWLNNSTPLTDVTAMLNSYASNEMNAYPISDKVKNVENNEADVIQPLGDLVDNEIVTQVNSEFLKLGFGRSR